MKKFWAMLSALTMGTTIAEATPQPKCEPQDVECACREAIAKGTIEAMEEFIYRYGRRPEAVDALCRFTLVPQQTRLQDDHPHIPY